MNCDRDMCFHNLWNDIPCEECLCYQKEQKGEGRRMKNEEWINTFINKFNESKDYKITDVRDRENLLDELRPTGVWYYSCQNGWHCSICQQIVKDMPTVMGKANFDYCPNCGAKMKEINNEKNSTERRL